MKPAPLLVLLALIFALTACAPPPKPVTGQPWTNSLGVKFVPAGTDNVLFSIWDVRVKDWNAFKQSTGYNPIPRLMPHGNIDDADFDTIARDDSPATFVNWNEANLFCEWLTKKEQAEGRLAPNQHYRLPHDAEWSRAVGLGENLKDLPHDKEGRLLDVFPWGTQWPPPPGAGNFLGEEARRKYGNLGPNSLKVLTGYNDGYVEMSPVGSFPPNNYGLYDMSGNVWQWCEEAYLPMESMMHDTDTRVLRGGSWRSSLASSLLSFAGNRIDASYSSTDIGFRPVLVIAP